MFWMFVLGLIVGALITAGGMHYDNRATVETAHAQALDLVKD
jgi:hypothetical protein